MALDNRELAWLICIALSTGLLIWKAKAFKPLWQLIRQFFSRPILTVFGAATGYIAICIWLLSLTGSWQWSNLKTTLIWAGSFALVAVFNFQKIETGKAFFRTVLLETVGINAFLSFITASHTFNLWIELPLTGALVLLGLTYVVAERNNPLKPASTCASILFALLALLQLGNSSYHIVTELRAFATLHTAREFFVPILLTLMFLPFLYGLHIYSVYERVVAAFKNTTLNPTLRDGIVRKLVTRFGLDLAGLEKWRRHIGLFPPETSLDLITSIAEIRSARRREKRPYRVGPAHGWLPNYAINFLASAGLTTNDYHRSYDDWTACSRYRDLGDDLLPNNLAYYVEGDEFVVSQLKLMLNVNAPNSAKQAYEHFFDTVALLARSAIPGVTNDADELSLVIDGAPLLLNGYELTLEHNDWPNGIKGGHDLAFTIRIADTPSAPEAQ